MTGTNPFPQPICEQIWNDKYKLETPNPDIPNDTCVEDTWARIAHACAMSEPEIYGKFSNNSHNPSELFLQYVEALNDFKFIPAGRITAGAGSGRSVTLFNCYVMGTIPDSMGGIFDMLKEAALTMQQGGGIGYDFSPLRPANAPVKGVDADASGPITFMNVWDAMCRTVMSAGSRRGAMMATMMCDHPDIEAFITAKRDPLALRMFNLSVLITDKFMEAVERNLSWDLVHEVAPSAGSKARDYGNRSVHVYKTIMARDLWNLIMQSTYAQAEPGVIFIDRINTQNNLWYMENISATNPCGEQPLPPYGACLLGSINLTKMVVKPFDDDGGIDYDLLIQTTKAAVRMLDAVIDISNFPIPQQKAEAKEKRRMGIGISGLADALFMMNVTYGTDVAADIAETIMNRITISAYEESIELAKEFGPCPATATLEQRQKFIESGFMQGMPHHIKNGIIKWGIRNTHLTSVAPTGTISLYAGNISSGVEPIFAPKYTRKVLEKDGSRREEVVEDYAIMLYREMKPGQASGHLVTAQDLKPMEHLRMQAAVQKWVDSSISKTINCPEDISYEDFVEVYLEAWKQGCKGCTTYRPNAITGSVLSVETKQEEKGSPELITPQVIAPTLEKRPDSLKGLTYKVKAGTNHAMYISMSYSEIDGKKVPYEVFMNSKNMDHFAWTVALTRMISAIFRRGGDVSFVVEELKAVFDPRGGSWIKGKYVPSDAAAIGGVIEQFMKDIDYISNEVQITSIKDEPIPSKSVELVAPILCTSCFGSNFKKEAGCETCIDCGHSKCG